MQRLCADKKLLLAYLIVIDYKFDFLEVVSASLRQGEHNLEEDRQNQGHGNFI